MRRRRKPLDAPEPTNVAARLLERVAQVSRPALAFVDSVGVIERVSFAEVGRRAAQWAALLRDHGVVPGARVVVLAGRDQEWRSALLGVLHTGGVAVPCREEMPIAEIRAIAADAGALLIVSAAARPDLAQGETPVLSADETDPRDAPGWPTQRPHKGMPNDVALILYGRDTGDLRGAMHTHASLLAQAFAGGYWLDVREGDRAWCTAAEGSVASIWLMLTAWRQGAEIVVVDHAAHAETQLELLDKLRPAAVWFTDGEYAELAATVAPDWLALESTRAIASDARVDGAVAFQEVLGAMVAPVYGSKETGAVAGCPTGVDRALAAHTLLALPAVQLAILDERGNQPPAGEVGDVAVRGDAPSLFAGYAGAEARAPRADEWFRVGGRGAVDAVGNLRPASPTPLELERVEGGTTPPAPAAVATVEEPVAAAIVAPDAEADGAEREAEERRLREEAKSKQLADEAAAKERRRAEEEKRREKERSREEKRARREAERQAKEHEKAEQRRLREEAKSKKLADDAAAKERRRAEEAAKAEEHRRAEEAKRAQQEEERQAKERQKAEEARLREEAEKKKLADEAAAKERARAEEAEQARLREDAEKKKLAEEAERARAESEKRDRKSEREEKRARREAEQQAKERQKAEERRLREEAKNKKLADEAAAKERARAQEAERARAESEKRDRKSEREEKRAQRVAEQQAKEHEKAEERRLREEAKNKKLADEAASKERARADRETAKAEEARRREKAKSGKPGERGTARERRRAAAAEAERLAPDIHDRIGQYGVTAPRPEPRRPREPVEPAGATDVDDRGGSK